MQAQMMQQQQMVRQARQMMQQQNMVQQMIKSKKINVNFIQTSRKMILNFL